MHILVWLAYTAKTEGSGWSGGCVGHRKSWVRGCTWTRTRTRARFVKTLGFCGKYIGCCTWNATIGETSAGVGGLTTRARWDWNEWVRSVVVAVSRMLLHIRCFGSWRNHRLLFHCEVAVPMRGVVSTRLFWLMGAPSLNFFVDWLMRGVSALAASTAGQTPAAESNEKTNNQSTNHTADYGHNQGGAADARMSCSC